MTWGLWKKEGRYGKKDDKGERQTKVRPFHETYKIVTFAMSAGMLYPNPKTEKLRITVIFLVYTGVAPVTLVIMIDIYNSWVRRDIQNIIRHGTIFIPFLLVLTKMYLMYHNRIEANKIIEEINRDHDTFNSLPESYMSLFEDHLKTTKFGEMYWLIIVCHSVMIFPIMAALMTIFNELFIAEPKKYMMHDVLLPNLPPEARFESPYFEGMFVYMLFCCVIYLLNFVGYDGFFGIAINHACMKMKLYCRQLKDGLRLEREEEIYEVLRDVVKAQCRVYNFVETIQKTFNFWLGMIFIGTVVHVCNCMYQIMEGMGFDLKYLIFIAGSVIHIYLPCKYASKLKTMSLDTSTSIYCSGWESLRSQRGRKTILYMIARAQLPSIITAFNMLTFDMELFVSILHTSYSMFTLLRS